jgi:hypothetical protein
VNNELCFRSAGVFIREKVWLENSLSLVHPSHLPAYKNGTECSETSAHKLQMPGNYLEESIQY